MGLTLAVLLQFDPARGAGRIGNSDSKLPIQAAVCDRCVRCVVRGDSDSRADRNLDGGINDVQATTIVDPMESLDSLDDSITQHCYREMLTLLKCVASKFENSQCKIVVTGYFPIFGQLTWEADINRMLGTIAKLLGRDYEVTKGHRESLNLWKSDPVERSEHFWRNSTAALKRAIRECGDSRVLFVDSGILPDNALFAPDEKQMLWDLNLDFTPKDPMRTVRKPLCDLYEPHDFVFCPRASFGHPNQKGAASYVLRIKAALGLP